jgi:hypothetical protein
MYNYTKAERRSKDRVTVTVTDSVTGDVKQFTYSKDATQTNAEFKAMVKAEIKAHINYLNIVEVPIDVTADFTPNS